MKNWKKLAMFVVLTVVLGRIHAQAQQLQPVSNAPETGTFFLLSAESEGGSPPYPYDPYGGVMPVFQINGLPNQFLVSDSSEDFKALQSLQTKLSAGGGVVMNSLEFPGEGEEGGGEGGGGTNYYSGLVLGTNDLYLTLIPESLTNSGTVDLTIHNPEGETNDLVGWHVWATTNLAYCTDPWALDADNWAWVAATEPGQTNVTVPVLSELATFYRLAHPLADADSDGLPDYYCWAHFGHQRGWASDHSMGTNDYDSDGLSNYDEYLAGSNPNDFTVATHFSSLFVNQQTISGGCEVQGGVPYAMAVLVNDTNLAAANWQLYTSNFSVTLGAVDGVYAVRVALRGRSTDFPPVVDYTEIALDRIAPMLVITNPISASSTVTKPFLQLLGQADEALAELSYGLANAAGSLTNEPGYVVDQWFDTNRFEFTTNFFQCYDIELTNGANTILLRATDLAGNVSTTNLSVTLDYSTVTGPPGMQVAWPQDGMQISGTSFTLRGTLDDETALVTAQMVDADDNTNFVAGVVERNGKFWIENVPLADGDNYITVNVTNRAGIGTNLALTVSKSEVNLTIDSVPQDATLYQGKVTVWGSINASNYTIFVNDVPATNGWWNGAVWNWYAEEVPVRGEGTTVFDAVAYPPEEQQGMMSGTLQRSSVMGSASASVSAAVAASATVEMPAYIARVEYHATKAVKRTDGTTNFNNYARVKEYKATYEPDPSGTWTATFHGTATDNSEDNNGWSKSVYDWSNTARTTHFTDSNAQDILSTNITESYSEVTGLPDQDLTAMGWLGGSGGVGAYPPTYIYHYYASGVHHRWSRSDGSTADATVKARTRDKLFTGGKAVFKRKSLFRINASAEEYGKPPDDPWMSTPGTPVAPTKIKVLGWWLFGKRLDNSGDLYITLPDNAVKDLNLRIPGVKHYNANTSVEKIRFDLSSVAFGGSLPMLRDDGSGPYDQTHWWTNETTRAVNSSPVLYVSGSNVQANVTFNNHATSVNGVGGDFPLIIKGEVSGGNTSFKLWGTNASTVGASCSVDTYADHPLTANTVDFFKPMTIKWYYGYTNKPNYIYAGTSTNQMYVALSAPTTANLFHTVVHLACSKSGAADANAAAANTWSHFSGPGNVKAFDGAILHYYQSGVPWANNVTDVGTLLSSRNGQCNSWRELLESSWCVNGVACDPASVSAAGGQLFLVKNLGFGAPTLTNNPPYNYLFLIDASNGSMVGVGNYGDLQNQNGVAGQNSPTPAEKAFGSHYIQRFNGIYFDPSYGVTYADAADFQAKAVVGFGVNPSLIVPGRIAFEVKPTTNTVEIQIVP